DTFARAPDTPTNLAAATVSTSQIDLDWDDVAYEDGYAIERAPNGTNSWTAIGSTAKNVTTFHNIALTPNTTYYYRVRATNSSGDSDYSKLASDTTPDVLPLAPTNLAAVSVSTTQIDLSWTDVAGEDNYTIERSLDGVNNW